jgi:hypothetical protein
VLGLEGDTVNVTYIARSAKSDERDANRPVFLRSPALGSFWLEFSWLSLYQPDDNNLLLQENITSGFQIS